MLNFWLFSTRSYLIAILMVAALLAITLEEMTYWCVGQTTTASISSVVEEPSPVRSIRGQEKRNRNTYQLEIDGDSSPVTGAFFQSGLKVGDPLEVQHFKFFGVTWSRPARMSKPWLGWGGFVLIVIVCNVGYTLGKEASDPFAKAREQRYRQRREA